VTLGASNSLKNIKMDLLMFMKEDTTVM